MYIYYTKSYCYVEPVSNITCMIISIKGGGIINDTTPQEYSLTYRGKKIIIFAYERKVAGLDKLFTFRGNIKIQSCKVIFTNERPQSIGVQSRIKNNSSNKLNITPESMTLNTEEYNNYNKRSFKGTSGRLAPGISLQIKTKDDIVSSIPLWTKENEPYEGMVHYHLDGKYKGKFLSGATYTDDSKILFRTPLNKILKPAITNPTLKRFMRNIKR